MRENIFWIVLVAAGSVQGASKNRLELKKVTCMVRSA